MINGFTKTSDLPTLPPLKRILTQIVPNNCGAERSLATPDKGEVVVVEEAVEHVHELGCCARWLHLVLMVMMVTMVTIMVMMV